MYKLSGRTRLCTEFCSPPLNLSVRSCMSAYRVIPNFAALSAVNWQSWYWFPSEKRDRKSVCSFSDLDMGPFENAILAVSADKRARFLLITENEKMPQKGTKVRRNKS